MCVQEQQYAPCFLESCYTGLLSGQAFVSVWYFRLFLEMGFHCRGLTGFELTVDQAGLELKKFASQMLGLKA